MTVSEFTESFGNQMPEALSPELQALWYLGTGDWDTAHKAVRYEQDADNAWIHAHLHKINDDAENAKYWYSKSNRDLFNVKVEDEFLELLTYFLNRTSHCLLDF